MDYNIFENEKDKREARAALPNLTKHPGWKYIIKALDANIAFLSNELKEKKDFTSLEEVYALQDRINDFTKFKDLPATIVEEAAELPEEENPDPFE